MNFVVSEDGYSCKGTVLKDLTKLHPTVSRVAACLLLLLGVNLTELRCAYAQIASSPEVYVGEYVVTLPRYSKRPNPSDRMVAYNSDGLQGAATVLRRLGGYAAVVSSARQSTTSQPRGGSVTRQVAQVNDDDLFCKDLLVGGLVESCTPNYRVTINQGFTEDPMYGDLWGLANSSGVAALSAWEVTTGSPEVAVAIIDTGIDYNHPDLAANVWNNPGEVPSNGLDDDGNGYVDDVRGANTSVWATRNGDPFDDNQHGTHVAGTIGAINSNGIGVTGINHRVTLIPIKFLDASGAGRLSDAIAAIDYMVDLKVNRGVNIRVANNSWGGGAYSPALLAAIQRARDAGIVFVVAAGNNGSDIDLFPSYPASYEVSNVVTVAATDSNQNLATFSNYGAETVDVAAPGVDIVSTLPNDRYGALSGTSMATPHVAGSLALLFAAEPGLSVEQAIARVLEAGRELPGLLSNGGTVALVGSRRLVDASRMVRNQTAPIVSLEGELPACGYNFEVATLGGLGDIDTLADRAPIINQVDEGDYYRIDLPFEFPFFRTKTSTLWISPNGLVYLNEPAGPDYQLAPRAPNNSIAAFHSDLTPRAANQGVRVHKEQGRLTVFWSSEHYSLMGRGPVSVRLSLFDSGAITSTLTFESMSEPTGAAGLLLGDPFSEPPVNPLGVVGASATSSRLSSTLDLLSAQRSIVSGPNQLGGLRVNMVPNCFTSKEGETKLAKASINTIKLKLLKDKRRIVASFIGAGNGSVPLGGVVNGRQCAQTGRGNLVEGIGRATISLPSGVSRFTLKAPQTEKTVAVGPRQRQSRRAHTQQCERLMKSLAG